MAKQKKTNFTNQTNNKGRTIVKDKSARDQSNYHHNPVSSRPLNQSSKVQKKAVSTNPIKEAQVRDSKQKNVSGLMASQKKPLVLRADQIQAALASLIDLQKLLNSYEQLQMDKNENVKFLVQNILQKQTKTQ